MERVAVIADTHATAKLARHMRRLARVLPRLMEEFGTSRDPKEVLDCADAVLLYYEERRAFAPSPSLVRRRTRQCLEAGTCEGLATR